MPHLTTNASGAPHWYAITTPPGRERKVAEELRAIGCATLVPIIEHHRHRSRRARSTTVVEVELALPGYVLAGFPDLPVPWLLIWARTTARGVVGTIGGAYGGEPLLWPMHAVEAVRRMGSRDALDPADGERHKRAKLAYSEGDLARVVKGPFRDFMGRVESIGEHETLMRLDIFGRETQVEIDRDWLRKETG